MRRRPFPRPPRRSAKSRAGAQGGSRVVTAPDPGGALSGESARATSVWEAALECSGRGGCSRMSVRGRASARSGRSVINSATLMRATGTTHRRALQRGHRLHSLLFLPLELGVEGQHRGVQPQVLRVQRSDEQLELLYARAQARVESNT